MARVPRGVRPGPRGQHRSPHDGAGKLRNAATVTCIGVTVAMISAGCSYTPYKDLPEPSHPTPTTEDQAEGLTPVLTDVGFQIEPSTQPGYEVRLRVLDEPTYSSNTGDLTIKFHPDDGVAGLDRSVNNQVDVYTVNGTHCGFQHGRDLVVPIVFGIRDLGASAPANPLYVGLDTTYGFMQSGKTIFTYTTEYGLIRQDDCQQIGPQDNSLIQEQLAAPGVGSSFGYTDSIWFLYIRNGGLLPVDDQHELMNSLTVHPMLFSPLTPGDTVKMTYTNPQDTRLLEGNGCAAVFEPLERTIANKALTTLAEQKCDNPLFTQGQ